MSLIALGFSVILDKKAGSGLTNEGFSIVKHDEDFSLLAKGTEHYIYIKYGSALVTFGMDELEARETVSKLKPTSQFSAKPLERLLILEGDAEEAHVEFESVKIPQISPDYIHIIALIMAQSISIDQFNEEIYEMLEESKESTSQLARKGRVFLNRIEVRKRIGKALQIKNQMAEELYIHETPDVAWEDEDFIALNRQLKLMYHIERRYEGLQHNFSVVRENYELYKDILQHKHSSTLEWIIIVLILFEIIHVLIR